MYIRSKTNSKALHIPKKTKKIKEFLLKFLSGIKSKL